MNRLGRFEVRLERKWQDIWIGAFWKSSWFVDGREAARRVDVWLCVVPCFPIHIAWAGPWEDNPMLRRAMRT